MNSSVTFYNQVTITRGKKGRNALGFIARLIRNGKFIEHFIPRKDESVDALQLWGCERYVKNPVPLYKTDNKIVYRFETENGAPIKVLDGGLVL